MVFIFLSNDESICLISIILDNIFSEFSDVMNFNSTDRKIKYSSSKAEPSEIWINLARSLLLPLPQPSAIFAGIEIAALLICETRLNRSLAGNDEVIL